MKDFSISAHPGWHKQPRPGPPDSYFFSLSVSVSESNGFRFAVPDYARHRPAAKAILSGRLYEPITHEFVGCVTSKLEGSVVTAGAFFGDFLPSFSGFTQGNVYAFEPVLENYLCAGLTVELNDLHNVRLYHSALGDDIGSVDIETLLDGQHAGGASRLISSEGDQRAPQVRLDAFGINDLVLLQLDVEGSEYGALEGARETIFQNRPIVAIEDNGKLCGPLLESYDYAHIGRIPGLSLWASARNADSESRVIVEDFVSNREKR
jgi:FkbM family methyltransferase